MFVFLMLAIPDVAEKWTQPLPFHIAILFTHTDCSQGSKSWGAKGKNGVRAGPNIMCYSEYLINTFIGLHLNLFFILKFLILDTNLTKYQLNKFDLDTLKILTVH